MPREANVRAGWRRVASQLMWYNFIRLILKGVIEKQNVLRQFMDTNLQPF